MRFLLIFVLIISAGLAEDDLYMKTKIKYRSKLQQEHDVFKGSAYHYEDDHTVKRNDSEFGNVKTDDKDIKKIYNYVDVKKDIKTDAKFKAGNVEIGEKSNVKEVNNYVHIQGVKSKGGAQVGNLKIKQNRVHGKFSNIVESKSIKSR